VSTVRLPGSSLWRTVDKLAAKLERKVLPTSARELSNADLSDHEALTLAIFAECRAGDGSDERQEKVALAGVLGRRANSKRPRSPAWRSVIEKEVPAYRGPRWQIGAALRFERAALLSSDLRRELEQDQPRLNRHLVQATEIADLALSGSLPRNTPDADRFASEGEIADAKARGQVAPSSLVHYGDHWFYAARRSVPARRSAPGRVRAAPLRASPRNARARSKANPARASRATRAKSKPARRGGLA